MTTQTEIAIFGNGCFWCTEVLFQKLKGVNSVAPGYAGGTVENPSYHEVCEGNTGHAEVLKVEFEPSVISYEDLLDVFWHTHDPTTLNKQGNDVGTQYRSVIFYTSEEQKQKAQESKKSLEEAKEFARPIVTEIQPIEKFYVAEDYHHNYYNKNDYQPYCQIVIAPKIHKFMEKYGEKVKS